MDAGSGLDRSERDKMGYIMADDGDLDACVGLNAASGGSNAASGGSSGGWEGLRNISVGATRRDRMNEKGHRVSRWAVVLLSL